MDFSYPSRHDELAIEQFSLDIEPGEHVAFVGPSGAGKSTILQLLLRFYDPQSGRIYIDGVDINLADPKIVRSLMALVPQDCVIFGDSVESNIRFGRPSASSVRSLSGQSSLAHDFIDQLPDGYDTFWEKRNQDIWRSKAAHRNRSCNFGPSDFVT